MGIEEAMRRRYKAPQWGLLFEVPNGTGGRKHRVASIAHLRGRFDEMKMYLDAVTSAANEVLDG